MDLDPLWRRRSPADEKLTFITLLCILRLSDFLGDFIQWEDFLHGSPRSPVLARKPSGAAASPTCKLAPVKCDIVRQRRDNKSVLNKQNEGREREGTRYSPGILTTRFPSLLINMRCGWLGLARVGSEQPNARRAWNSADWD